MRCCDALPKRANNKQVSYFLFILCTRWYHRARMSDLVLRFFTVLRFIPVVRYKLQTLPCTKLGHLSSVIIRVYICDIYLLVIAKLSFFLHCGLWWRGGVVVCVVCAHTCAHVVPVCTRRFVVTWGSPTTTCTTIYTWQCIHTYKNYLVILVPIPHIHVCE